MSQATVLLWFLFVFILILIGIWGIRKALASEEPIVRTRGQARAVGGAQMEFDMRLPYRRFKELYPYSEITYEEYKQMQMRRAYRRAVSSEKNKRMVR